MNCAVTVFLLSQISAIILEYTRDTQKNIIDTNGKKMSPKEKLKYERKTIFFDFFYKLLKYGSAVFLLLSILLEVLITVRR